MVCIIVVCTITFCFVSVSIRYNCEFLAQVLFTVYLFIMIIFSVLLIQPHIISFGPRTWFILISNFLSLYLLSISFSTLTHTHTRSIFPLDSALACVYSLLSCMAPKNCFLIWLQHAFSDTGHGFSPHTNTFFFVGNFAVFLVLVRMCSNMFSFGSVC